MKKSKSQKMFDGALRLLAREEKERSPEMKNMQIGMVEAYILLCRKGQSAKVIVDDCMARGYIWNDATEKWRKG